MVNILIPIWHHTPVGLYLPVDYRVFLFRKVVFVCYSFASHNLHVCFFNTYAVFDYYRLGSGWLGLMTISKIQSMWNRIWILDYNSHLVALDREKRCSQIIRSLMLIGACGSIITTELEILNWDVIIYTIIAKSKTLVGTKWTTCE